MAIGRPKAELVLSTEEHAQVSALAASRSLPHAIVARAKLVMWAAQDESNAAIAERLGWSLPTVGKWRQRFVERRVAGLHDELRPGRPRTYGDEQVAGLINRVLRSQAQGRHATGACARRPKKPASPRARWLGTSHCSVCNRIAARASSSPPTRSSWRRCATSWDFTSIRRTRRWCCAWTRRARCRPWSAPSRCCRMGLGYVEGVTHDYYRHGTTTLFAALNVLDGSVITQCKPRHRHQEFLCLP